MPVSLAAPGKRADLAGLSGSGSPNYGVAAATFLERFRDMLSGGDKPRRYKNWISLR